MPDEIRDSEAGNKQPYRKHPRFGRRLVVSILCTATVTVVCLYLSSLRPRWQTRRVTPRESGKIAFLIDYPADWTCEENTEQGHGSFYVAPKRPIGFVRWWCEHVWKQNTFGFEQNRVLVNVNCVPCTPEAASQYADAFRANYKNSLLRALQARYRKVRAGEYSNASGKCWDIEATEELPGPAVSAFPNPTSIRWFICRGYNPASGVLIDYGVSARIREKDYPLLKPTINEIIRCVRFVEESK